MCEPSERAALTPKGRDLHDTLGLDAFPSTDAELDADDLAYYVRDDSGRLTPIVYEDFLPKSAAGIFASNLTGEGQADSARKASVRDVTWLREVIGREVHDPYALYEAERAAGYNS